MRLLKTYTYEYEYPLQQLKCENFKFFCENNLRVWCFPLPNGCCIIKIVIVEEKRNNVELQPVLLRGW